MKLAAAHVELLSCQGIEQQQAETVDIGFRGDLIAVKADLFRRNIVVLAGKAGADNGLIAQLGGTGDAEIDDLGPRHIAQRNDNIIGRHIAMNNSALMSRLEARGDAPHQLHQRLERQRTVHQNIRQRTTIDEFHRQIWPLQRWLDRKKEVAHDGVVRQMMKRRRLPAEQRQCRLVFRHIRQKHLDCHGGAGLNFVTLVDFAHATGADHLIDFVNAIQARAGCHAAIRRTERLFRMHCRHTPDHL